MSTDDRVYKARWILPVTSDPIHGGWIRIRQNRILEIGRNPAPSSAEDLGDVAVLPQLVNAHTHLEFSDCQCPIGESGMSLAGWIGEVVAARAKSPVSKRNEVIEAGIRELIDSGTSLAAEITTPPSQYRIHEGELFLIAFAEVLGLSSLRGQERLEAAKKHCHEKESVGVSPHAPYSTSPETIASCVAFAQDQKLPLAMHIAESPEERELLLNGSGPFVDALMAIGAWREGLFPTSKEPFQCLIDRLSAAPRALLIHGNDLNEGEIHRIASHQHLSVVYCPRTHHYFGHQPHPVDQMLASGIRVALGTDSRASNPDLNLWNEVRYLLRERQDLAPHDVLKMATRFGAESLGKNHLGHLGVGAQARLGLVRTEAGDLEGLYEDWLKNDLRPYRDSSA